MRTWAICIVAAACVASSCSPQTYLCESSEQCNAGQCQPTGYCSFPDETCESGQRYGKFSSASLRGQCVELEPEPATTSTVTSSASADPSTSSTSTDALTSTGPDPSTGILLDDTTTGPTGDTSTGQSSSSTGIGEVDPDLVAWWRLDNDPALGAIDATANALDGSCMICPTSVPAIHENGFVFTGTEIITVDQPGPFATDTFTVAAWTRIAAVGTPTSYHHVVTKPVGTGNRNSWELILQNSDMVRLNFVVSNPSASSVTTTTAPELGAWFHFAGTFDGTTVRLYVDGIEQAQAMAPTDGVAWDDHPVVIGGDSDSRVLEPTFMGDIDDIRVYNRALDAGEVAALAQLL